MNVAVARLLQMTYCAKEVRNWIPHVKAPSSSIQEQPTYQSWYKIRYAEWKNEIHKYVSATTNVHHAGSEHHDLLKILPDMSHFPAWW